MKQLLLVTLLLFSISFSNAQCDLDITLTELELKFTTVTTDGEGNIYAIGHFNESATVNGTTFTTDHDVGILLVKYDVDYNISWVNQLPGDGFYAELTPVIIDDNNINNIQIIIAETESNNTGIDIMRIWSFTNEADWNVNWSQTYEAPKTESILSFGNQMQPLRGELDSNGDIIIAGAFVGDISNTNTATTFSSPAPNSEAFVIKLDKDGNELWTLQSSGGSYANEAFSLAINSISNSVYIGGYYTNSIEIDGVISAAVSDPNVRSPFVAEINSLGIPQWITAMEGGDGTNEIYDLVTDNTNIYFTGYFNNNILIDGTTINSSGGTNALVGALNSDGTLNWANALGGTSEISPNATEFSTHINLINGNLVFGGQIVADNVFYNGVNLLLPESRGAFIASVVPTDGTFNYLSMSETFGYGTAVTSTNELVIARLNQDYIRKIDLTSRPIPVARITAPDGQPSINETLTAYDNGNYIFQWYKDNSPIIGENNSTFIATESGEYYMEVDVISGTSCPRNSQSYYLLSGVDAESDKLALIDLYNSTNGDNWTNNTNWITNPDISTWQGITVDGNGRVTRVDLFENNLSGTFPQSFGALSELEFINFSGNDIGGTIPNEFWNLTHLIEIGLHDNQRLNWTIDPNIGNMNNLQILRAFNTSLSGTIPSEIEGAASLTEFWVSDCNLTGEIPPSIGNLANLTYLDFNGNQLTGSIPNTLGNLTNMVNLILERNQLEGTIPTELMNLTNLETFDVRENKLEGTLADAIWQLPNLQVMQVDYNPNLEVILPSNLSSLTQLTTLGISGTIPIGGSFPAAIYSLTNLQVLDIGGHQFTGSLTSEIGNLTQIGGLWIFNNQLEGDFPIEISTFTNLVGGSIAGNKFTSFPDISALSFIQDFDISRNYLGFKDIIPNLEILNLNYVPQNRRESLNLTVDKGGTIDLINPYDEENNIYDWILNQESTGITSVNFVKSNASTDDLGGYQSAITNPAVPDLTIYSNYFNIAFSGNPRSWTVDNSPNSIADFKSLYPAIYGTNEGDTLYIMGSETPYNETSLALILPRVIYGPGYFLTENDDTQATTLEANLNYINIQPSGSGSTIKGINFFQLALNSQSSTLDGVVSDISLANNKFEYLTIADNNDNIEITKNFINQLDFWSTTAMGTSRFYKNILIENNIIDTVSTTIARATALRNEMENVVFSRNTIDVFTDSIQDVSLTNNIINNYEATGNTTNGTIGYGGANFANNSGTLSIDNDFVTTGIDAGAFSGAEPYVLSGIAPIPHIYELNNTGRIKFQVSAKNEINSNLVKINYRLGENGNLIDQGSLTSFEVGNAVSKIFRPKLAQVTPGATVNLMVWIKDVNGVRSVPQNTSFVAETTSLNGQIFTLNNELVTNGNVYLFEINQEGTAYDSLQTTLDNQGNYSFNNIVIGDYLAAAKADTTEFSGLLPTYFTKTDLWEEADTILIDSGNPSLNITLLEEPKPTTGEGTLVGIVEEELPTEDSNGRVLARRVRRGGVTVRRRASTGRPTEIKDGYEIFAYTESNDDGEFAFANLPEGEYRINIQYPGYPMDTLSQIDFTISEENTNYQANALVDNGKISVNLTVLEITGILDEIIEKVSVFPNPTTAKGINIQFNKTANLQGKVALELISIEGYSILSKEIRANETDQNQIIKLPFDHITSGTYILKINHDKGEIGTLRILVH